MKKWCFLVCFIFLSLNQLFSQCLPSFTYQADTNNFVIFTNQTPQNSAFTYQWDFGDGSAIDTSYSPTHQYSNSGSYVVMLSVDSGTITCGTILDTIYVNFCNAYFTAQTNNNVVQFQNSSAASSSSFHYWDFGDGNYSAQKNPIHTYQITGQYAVKLDVYDSLSGCFSSTFDSVIVTVPPCQANFNYATIKDTLFIQNQASNYQLISYDFGDSSTSTVENPTHIYNQSGTYFICQTVIDTLNNCTDTYCDSVNIYIPPPCLAGFTYSINEDSLFIQNTAANYQTLAYDFGDGNSSS
ncbi:MAG: PKD domain-containing protein, partial [Vicingaceae bacterium]